MAFRTFPLLAALAIVAPTTVASIDLRSSINDTETRLTLHEAADDRATIELSIPRSANVRLSVYDHAGRHVRTLVDRRVAPGEHPVRWNGRTGLGDAARPGVYTCVLSVDGAVTKTATLHHAGSKAEG